MSSSAGLNRSMKCRRTLYTCRGAASSMVWTAGVQKAHYDAARIGGVGSSDDQPELFHASQLMGESALLPLQQPAQFLRRQTSRRVLGEHGEDLVVGIGHSGVL